MSKKIFSVIAASCAIIISSASLQAQDAAEGDADVITKSKPSSDAIIITGRRYESSVFKEGKSVTVITEEDIKSSGKNDLSQILDTVPGITVTRQGTACSSVNIYIRGSKSGNILVMVDGVRINDPSDISKTVDLSLISTRNIERIEIVEGSMSSMYGAEASGGVINIITKKAVGSSRTLRLEAGAYDYFSQVFSVSENTGKSSFFFSGTHYSMGGISAVKDTDNPDRADEDDTDYYNFSGKMTGELWEKTSLMFTINYSDKEVDLDYDSGIDDDNYTGSGSIFTSSAAFSHSPFLWWNYRAGGSFMSSTRIYNNRDNPSVTGPNAGENWFTTYRGSGLQAHLLNNLVLPGAGILSMGAEVLHETADTSSAYYDSVYSSASFSLIDNRSVTTLSAYIHDAFSFNEMVFINAGARVDHHTEFGSYYTWDASGAFIVPVIKTRIRGSVGSGFKAPSLYQLYSTGYVKGNTDLKPEKSFVYDAGISQETGFGGYVLSVEGTYFYQRYRDAIDSVSNQYTNIDGEMSDRGFELASSFRFSDILSLRYAYTYLDFLKNNKSQPFWKRPEHKHSFIASFIPLPGLSINVSYLYVGSRRDYFYDYSSYTAKNVTLDPYHKIDANMRYSFNEMLTITVRGENLTDADYMDTYGYNTYGRSFFGGVELTF